MSEAKRVPLQTLEFPESLGHATKKEKKGNMGKQLAPSLRFTLTLPESNEKTCPEFNYAQLLKTAEKKRRKEQKDGEENATNGLDPFDEDDEDKLRDMAKRFEAKYGTSTMMGKKRRKYDEYVDLGAGYDENDSFIDNTDAYDEIVPEEMTTAHGGFYINCGALEFRAADRHTLVHNNNNNNNSDDDESSESSEEDTEDVDSPKRIDKRTISSSDDDETEDITSDNPRKRRKVEESGEKKNNHENKKRKKPPNHQTQDAQQNSQQDIDLVRRKEKNETTDAEGGTASEDQEEKKKPDKLEKNKISEKKFDLKKFEKKSSNSNGYDAKKIDLKRLCGKDSNIDDAIESVVNAAARGVEDDSSRDTTDSGKSRVCHYIESEEEMENKEASLPENLPEDIKEIVTKLKVQAENSKDSKSKFFNSAINDVLFNLEKKLRMLNLPSIRLQTYGHLVRFLPCSKITLLSRAKKLYLKDAEHRVNEPMQKLKTLIDNVMPSVMDKYMKECQKVADEKGFEGSPADAESSDEEDGSFKNTEKSKIPRKRFPWTDEAKKLVLEIANARRHYFKILRPRKESMESFVATFMDNSVLPLWPTGCVRLQTLLKYASPVEPVIKKKLKKSKEMANANNVATSGNIQICNSVAKNDTANSNNVLSQENEKANVSKTQTSAENSTNFANQATAKSNDISADRKQHSNKHKDKHVDNNAGQQQESSAIVSINNSTVGKISVVPTAQLMAQKSVKSHVEKFNLMDLTSSSLSITPVNDYHKLSAKTIETKKDVVSITACSEPVSHSKPNEISQTGHHSVYRQDSYSSAQVLKHRFLQENTDAKCDKRLDDKDVDTMVNKTDKKDKRRERCVEIKHKSSHDPKKRKKDQKVIEIGPITQDVVPMPQQTTLSKEEQEQRQNEETIAATNYLSQIINDDSSPRGLTDKRKDGFITDDTLGNIVQPTEQEKDVQMVMRSLKELQELQEMKYSPSNSPVSGTTQKPGKSNASYITYQEEYQRLYLKKEDKVRSKEEAQW
ncbi:ubinuclein-1 isoform X2 [Anoplolepis gracilipes]|uniref:ubinuclein-1 isoform X2 n=1 Tax=Anoplolepis gracilipes TaxID=354296 RepID=UPI003B9EF44D